MSNSTHPDWAYPEGYNLSSFDQMLEQDPEPYGPDPALRVLDDETGGELTPEEFDEALFLTEQLAAQDAMDEQRRAEQAEFLAFAAIYGLLQSRGYLVRIVQAPDNLESMLVNGVPEGEAA